jgi:septum formation topological specificity factor MinE
MRKVFTILWLMIYYFKTTKSFQESETELKHLFGSLENVAVFYDRFGKEKPAYIITCENEIVEFIQKHFEANEVTVFEFHSEHGTDTKNRGWFGDGSLLP